MRDFRTPIITTMYNNYANIIEYNLHTFLNSVIVRVHVQCTYAELYIVWKNWFPFYS